MDNYKNKIANYLNSGIDDAAKELLLKLFPELKDSEDGRIRKAIKLMYSFLPNEPTYIGGVPVKDIFAWLEKQGEQNLANSAKTCKDEQKPAWSEEDETGLTNTIIMLKEGANLHFNKKDITKAVNWLKSLKDRVQSQNTWKPSDEQIMALRWVLNHIPYDSHKEEISGLLEQLNKLK